MGKIFRAKKRRSSKQDKGKLKIHSFTYSFIHLLTHLATQPLSQRFPSICFVLNMQNIKTMALLHLVDIHDQQEAPSPGKNRYRVQWGLPIMASNSEKASERRSIPIRFYELGKI